MSSPVGKALIPEVRTGVETENLRAKVNLLGPEVHPTEFRSRRNKLINKVSVTLCFCLKGGKMFNGQVVRKPEMFQSCIIKCTTTTAVFGFK